jgi:hypothetical protein
MGLKSGSRDSGLEDTEEDEEQAERDSLEAETIDEDLEENQEPNTTTESEVTEGTETATASDSTGGRPSMSSIPYKLRREKVNEGREQVPYFLREEIIDAEDELQTTLEGILGEDVYKSDYREAAMVVAQQNPELVAEVLREWGYDLEAT